MTGDLPTIRVLPMRGSEFDGHDQRSLQRTFFRRDLIERDGRYWFRERGLNAVSGAIVLFQFDNAIVASATLLDVTRYKRAQDGYWGYFDFSPPTIRTFDPVGPDQMRQAWPEFKRFSHVRQELDSSGYPEFLKASGQRGRTIAESIMIAVARVVGSEKAKRFSREDVRRAGAFEQPKWGLSYNPTFQGMRIDHPGHAPLVAKKFRGVFRRLKRGVYVLTPYGQSLIPSMKEHDDGRHTLKLEQLAKTADDDGKFDSKDQSDERERAFGLITLRRGQHDFRRRLLRAYDGRCAITRTNAPAALEAAHISPYRGDKSDRLSNGLLLRSDLHTLFDLDLLGIHPTKLVVVLGKQLRSSSYASLHGRKLHLPEDPEKRPDKAALKRRWREFSSG